MGTLIYPLNYFKPRDYQEQVYAALDRGVRRLLLVWARQKGKDTACFTAVAGFAMRNPGNYFYVFPTKEEARKALWEKIDQNGKPLLSCLPKSRVIKISRQAMLIELRSGDKGDQISTIRVVGLDHNPDSIRGITPRGVVFSEFAYQDPEVFKVILPAIQEHPDAWVIYQSTPNGKNHFYHMYKKAVDSPHWFVSLVQSLNPDKPGYVQGTNTPDQIRAFAIENGQTDEEVEQEYGCSWEIGSSGSVLATQIEQARKEGRIGSFPYNPHKLIDTGHDLGGTNPHVIWFRQKDGDLLKCVDYIKVTGHDLWEIAGLLKDRVNQYKYRFGSHFLPHDGTQMVQQFGLLDVDVFTKCLKNQGVSGKVIGCPRLSLRIVERELRAEMHRYCFDLEKCNEGVEDLENISKSWDRRKKVFTDDIRDNEFKHSFDALGTFIAAKMYGQDDKEHKTNLKRSSRTDDWDPFRI